MDGIGEALRSERLRLGLKLEQIATKTKIGQYLLQAIEANQFDRLPGGLLTRSFLRQYAQVLGLDGDEVVASFKQQFEEPVLALPAPQTKYRCSQLPLMPMLLWFVTAIVGCAGVYALWENVRRSLPETHAVRPARFAGDLSSQVFKLRNHSKSRCQNSRPRNGQHRFLTLRVGWVPSPVLGARFAWSSRQPNLSGSQFSPMETRFIPVRSNSSIIRSWLHLPE